MMKIYVDEFESIHSISYVVSAIHESHIPIIAQKLHAIYYHNKKWFHYILLQGIITSKCNFCDFDIR
jgi:hypothetical protein